MIDIVFVQYYTCVVIIFSRIFAGRERKNMRIGIPRAGMYYRYGTLWKEFFKNLGIETVLSRETDKALLDSGAALMVDESCLASKIFMGHTASLLDDCDMLFIPWISNFGKDGINCTRFRALNAITANIFRDRAPQILAYPIDYSGTQDMKHAASEEEAFISMHRALQRSRSELRDAYRAAHAVFIKEQREAAAAAEKKADEPGKKVLLVGRDYLIHDKYVGKPVTRCIEKLGLSVIDANAIDRAQAQTDFKELADDTLPWTVSRELLASIVKFRDRVDGIILLTGFPCGPDSMVNDIIARKLHDKPLLFLLLDGLDGTAGIETRIESFADIISFNEGGGVQ